jgi:DNA polymerase alpha-associated DNA helicase A
LILAGDPLQLPPTILSIANRVKEGKEKGKDKTTSGVEKKPPFGKTTKETKDPLVGLAAEPKTSSSTLPDSDGGDVGSSDGEEGSVGEAEAKMEPQASANKKDAKGKATRKLRTGLQPPRTLETTLFDRLEKMYGPGIKRILNVQYRCVPALWYSAE